METSARTFHLFELRLRSDDVDIPPWRLSSEQTLCERYGLRVDYEELVLHGKCANCLKGDSPSQ